MKNYCDELLIIILKRRSHDEIQSDSDDDQIIDIITKGLFTN
jgi:hypothetical protein